MHYVLVHLTDGWTLSLSTDWVEFSPYEIGMAKYGTFMTPDLFGSKFFMGTAVKKYKENPLHFLMGEAPQIDVLGERSDLTGGRGELIMCR